MISAIIGRIGLKGLCASLAVVIVVAIVSIGWKRIESLAAENERLRATYETVLQVNGSLSAQIKEFEVAMQNRERERIRLEVETTRLHNELRKVYENDEKAREWSVVDVPDSVLDCLLQAVVPSPGSSGNAAGCLSPGGA